MYRGRSKDSKSIIETRVMTPKLIHINVGIDGELWGRLNDARVKFGMTKASIIEEALTKWLEGRIE